jgi:hypothetical protein
MGHTSAEHTSMEPITTEFGIKLAELQQLQAYIAEQTQLQLAAAKPEPYCSEQIAELNTSLAKSQAEYDAVFFNRVNPYLDLQYVDLCNLIKASRPALTKNGLAVTQFIQAPNDGSTVLHTRLLHSSGQWMETRARLLPIKNDVAAYESTLNAQKRFSYMSLVGIVPMQDPGDDDGEIAMIKSHEYIARGPSEKQNPKKQSMDVISKRELEELEHELKDYPELAENLLDKLMLQSLADLPASQYRTTLIRIRKIKDELANRPREN